MSIVHDFTSTTNPQKIKDDTGCEYTIDKDTGAVMVPVRSPDGVSRFALVDVEDLEKVVGIRWYATKTSGGRTGTLYALSKMPAVIRNGKRYRKTIYMHRIVLGLTDPKALADHENGNGLDNRKSNLRRATHVLNHANSFRRNLPDRTCPYKGVHCRQDKSGRDRFVAKIGTNYKQRHIGVFDTPEEAARAYDREAVVVFGEFAYLNFPEEQG